MKTAVLAVVGAVVYGFAFWVMVTPGVPHFPFFVPLIVVTFCVPPIGAWWLVYMVIRREKTVFPMILLSLVPYGFVWYYFERVRSGTLIERSSADR